MTPDFLDTCPEKPEAWRKLLFSLSFFHAVVQVRLPRSGLLAFPVEHVPRGGYGCGWCGVAPRAPPIGRACEGHGP